MKTIANARSLLSRSPVLRSLSSGLIKGGARIERCGAAQIAGVSIELGMNRSNLDRYGFFSDANDLRQYQKDPPGCQSCQPIGPQIV